MAASMRPDCTGAVPTGHEPHARHSPGRAADGMLSTVMQNSDTLLIRYGAIPEVARFANPEAIPAGRGDAVVIETHRGQELGTVLESLRPAREPVESEPP